MTDSDPWFLSAKLECEGAGLDVIGPESEELIIRNYFNQVPSPDLVNPNGFTLKCVVVTHLAGLLVPDQYAQASPTALAEPIGQIETAKRLSQS